MEYYQPHLILNYLIYFLIVWFFIASFSTKKSKVNLNIFIMYVVNISFLPEIKSSFDSAFYLDEYIGTVEFLVSIDVFFGLVMFASNKDKDKYMWKQWALLCFAITCHSMILYDLTVSQSWLTGKFYTYYDELIIIIGLLQIWVSRDGIFATISRLQSFDHRIFFHGLFHHKLLFKSKKRDSKT